MSPSDRFLGVKPTARAYHGVSSIGDGDMCPVPGHGRKLILTKGQWCPHQSHDAERMSGYTEPTIELPVLDLGELS